MERSKLFKALYNFYKVDLLDIEEGDGIDKKSPLFNSESFQHNLSVCESIHNYIRIN